MSGRPFALLGVNSDRDLEMIRKLVVEKEIPWRSFQNRPRGSDGSISQAWSVGSWPTLIVLDEHMRMRHRSHSFGPASELVRKLVKSLEARRKK